MWGGGTPILFGTYNIWNRQNSGLELLLRGMGQANMDVRLFQETNLIDEVYNWGLSGYRVAKMLAPIRNRGGITLFYQESPNFAVKAICQLVMIVIA